MHLNLNLMPYCLVLPYGVLDCGNSSSHYECSPCAGNQWFSKDTGDYVDAVQVCKDQGYSGVINEYGGNGGTDCKYTNDKQGKHPTLHKFGYSVSWKCET